MKYTIAVIIILQFVMWTAIKSHVHASFEIELPAHEEQPVRSLDSMVGK